MKWFQEIRFNTSTSHPSSLKLDSQAFSEYWWSHFKQGFPTCGKVQRFFPESVCEGFFVSSVLYNHVVTSISAHLHICTSSYLHLCSSSHPHIYISHPHLSLFLTFSLKAGGSAAGPPRNAALCGDRACRVREMQARVRFASAAGNPLRRSCVSSARNAGESAICLCRGQPSAEIVRVECVKCRRECDLSLAQATLCCGDPACRMREMQARVRFGFVRRNPLRRSCVSSARNAGESAI